MRLLLTAAFVMGMTHWPLFADDPVPSAPVSRLLFGSCVKQDRAAPIFRTMLEPSPQLLLFLGDNIYADTSDMTVMRQKYETLASRDEFRDLLAACPSLATWDDHDYGQNDGGADYPMRDQAQRVFLDFWNEPVDSARRTRPGVYDARVFGPLGKRLQVILLDTRFFRSPLKQGERKIGGPYVPDDDPQKTMLGTEQWRWLEAQLRTPADVRVIASSIQCLSSAAGQETWANLPLERKRLFELIRKTRAAGVVIVSGDRHWSELSMTQQGVDYPLYDLTSSSFNQIHQRGTPTENRFRASPTTFHRENFGLIEIDWELSDPVISMEIRDIDNQTQISKQVRLSELQPSVPFRPSVER